MKKLFFCLMPILLLTGCATTQAYNSAINSWVGVNANQLMSSAWGYPDSQITLPDGNRVYCYKQSELQSTPLMPSPFPGMVDGGQIYQTWCTSCFEINSKNIIINATGKGNSCVEPANNPYRYTGLPQ